MPATDRLADTWVVVPMYNEATVIERTIAQLRERFALVVCVDDASTDGSGELATAAGARVVTHAVNLGQGAALQTGITYALTDPKARFVVTFDADGQHRVEDAAEMVELLEGPAPQGGRIDVVLGSRFLGGTTDMSKAKRAVLRAATAYTNFSVGLKLTDTHNGLRAFTRAAASGLRITQDGMAHATEILEQIAKNEWGHVEHPVQIVYTDYSKAKGQSILNSVNILVDLLLR